MSRSLRRTLTEAMLADPRKQVGLDLAMVPLGGCLVIQRELVAQVDARHRWRRRVATEEGSGDGTSRRSSFSSVVA